jgi:glycosyltransferase XagB
MSTRSAAKDGDRPTRQVDGRATLRLVDDPPPAPGLADLLRAHARGLVSLVRSRRASPTTAEPSTAPSLSLVPAPTRPRLLGEELLERGLVTAEQLDETLADAQRTGARLGELLTARGIVRRIDLYHCLSSLWGVPFCDLRQTPPDSALIARLGVDIDVLATAHWVPVGAYGDTMLVACSERPGDGVEQSIREATGWSGEIVMHATTEWDLRGALLRAFGAEYTRRASSSLAERSPEDSASRVITRAQVAFLVLLVTLVAIAVSLDPFASLAGLFLALNAAFACNVGFKGFAVVCGLFRTHRARRHVRAIDCEIPDSELPIYTVLVPAFGEANVVVELVEHLSKLDYPRDRLEVLLLLEEVDKGTIEAALGAGMPGFVRIVVVPDSQPRTKPKACNVGLMFARGEFLVIFDAEDRPEPDQLRKAVAMFRSHSDELVCVQGRLNYFNSDENLLTRCFTLEYSHWFDLMLEGLSALRLPLPLGGTSNHFRTELLRGLGGWDPHNVTEDADLGLRAAAKGFTVKTLDSTTYEEACCRTWPWIRQRTRWIKGYMQTTLVHTRHPIAFVRAAGLRATATLVLLVAGTPIAFLAAPVLWCYLILQLGLGHAPDVGLDGGVASLIASANLVVGNGIMVGCSALAAARRKRWGLACCAVLMPFYWVLHSIAAWRALGQLITNPSHWEKTPHGLSKQANHGVGAPTSETAFAAAPDESELATAA